MLICSGRSFPYGGFAPGWFERGFRGGGGRINAAGQLFLFFVWVFCYSSANAFRSVPAWFCAALGCLDLVVCKEMWVLAQQGGKKWYIECAFAVA